MANDPDLYEELGESQRRIDQLQGKVDPLPAAQQQTAAGLWDAPAESFRVDNLYLQEDDDACRKRGYQCCCQAYCRVRVAFHIPQLLINKDLLARINWDLSSCSFQGDFKLAMMEEDKAVKSTCNVYSSMMLVNPFSCNLEISLTYQLSVKVSTEFSTKVCVL